MLQLMKKHSISFWLFIVVFMSLLTSCNKDLLERVDELEDRVKSLEALTGQMNTNIASLQTILSAYQNSETISNISPINNGSEIIGYVISFSNGINVTIYNGTNNYQGSEPIVGIRQDTDGKYYWTLNGEWLTTANGQKICAQGENGITPQFRIENGYWYISYNNGSTWTQLGKATGNDGDSIFSSVTYDDDYVYFTLADGTSVITISREGGDVPPSVVIDNGALPGMFSISDTSQIRFSMGNLQYQASTGIWRFAERQFDFIGRTNSQISSTNVLWIDLFGWGTSGYHNQNDTYNMFFYPYSSSSDLVNETYNYDGYGPSHGIVWPFLSGESANYDWGIYNPISNGGNVDGIWRTLSNEEWIYLLRERNNASNKWGLAMVCDINGIILLPDYFERPDNIVFNIGSNNGFLNNNYNLDEWRHMEAAGAVFLPAAGFRTNVYVYHNGSMGFYWTSSYVSKGLAYHITLNETGASSQFNDYYRESNGKQFNRHYGMSVRLVQDVE